MVIPGLFHKFPIRNQFLATEAGIDSQVLPLFKQELISSGVLVDFYPDQEGVGFWSTAWEQAKDQ